MSDPKRATLITVGAPKSAKANVNKTVRLTINLDESNESKYPELNYKELVIAEEKKKRVQNGKTAGLDPFSDNDDDVERVARKFEQKYGGKSTYGRKGRSKQDDFADIGAGYDENDSFIDNTHGYDEMIPPECDTLYGGFYINSGSLEFKTVSQEQAANDDEPVNRRNKRRISSSSSEDDSSDSSSASETQDGQKDPKAIVNGAVDSHKTEHRKKKNKKIDNTKTDKVHQTDSSAPTSGKQTSDENVQADCESVDYCADSRTSQSDSLTSKPAPSSENPITSDSSRDAEAKVECKLPAAMVQALEALEASVARQLTEHPNSTAKQLLVNNEQHLLELDATVKKSSLDSYSTRSAWSRAAHVFSISRAKLMQRVKLALEKGKAGTGDKDNATTNVQSTPASTTTATTTTVTTNNKRKHEDADNIDASKLTEEQREELVLETLHRLKGLIEERKPSMLANYNAECERVQEERKKLQIASAAEGGPHIEKRLPKRRFPWCPRTRALLARLTSLAGNQHEAALLLAKRALPLFPNGFVRMPTLLRQADLSKEIKVSDIKRQRRGSASQPITAAHIQTIPQTSANSTPFEPIQFPSSLTVTTTNKTSPETPEPMDTDEKYKTNSIFGSIMNSFTLSKDRQEKDDKKEELYIPPNNIGSITITPVPNQPKEKKSVIVTDKSCSGLIRVKSPAALNEMVNKKDVKVIKKQEKPQSNKERSVESPLHIDTSYQPSKKDPSPRNLDGNYNKKESSPKNIDVIYNTKEPSPKNLDGAYHKTEPNPKNPDGNYSKKDTHSSKKDSNLKTPDTNFSKKDTNPKNVDGSYVKKDSNPKNLDGMQQSSKKDPNTKSKDEVTRRQIETMRVAENNIPRPALVPVQHSPTFAKPDKRPPEPKKKKDIIVVSDLDPLADVLEPVNVDDSSSDVEVVESATDKSDSLVPSKDKKNSVKSVPKVRDGKDEDATDSDIDTLMRNIREMEHSQETTKFNSNSYGGVITSAKQEQYSQGRYVRNTIFAGARNDKDKLAE